MAATSYHPPRLRLTSVAAALLAPSYGALCCVLLWAGINTGPGNIDLDAIRGSWSGLFNGVRATFPLVVLAMSPIYLLLSRRGTLRRFSLPEGLWIFYGLVCMVSGIYEDPWFDFAYWGFAWLGAFAAAAIFVQGERNSLQRGVTLNHLNWLLCTAVLVTVVWVGRGALLTDTNLGVSGYGVDNRIGTVAGMPMVRATGIARLAAIPALLSFVWIWNPGAVTRVLSAAVLAPTLYLVWVMQSRGATLGFVVALVFMLMLMGGWARRFGFLVVAAIGAIYLFDLVPDDTIHHVFVYATRGQQGEALLSMSGRTRIFGEVWSAISQAPFIGYGPQADRWLPFRVPNAQNAFLYALLCGGFIGGSAFIAGLVITWAMLIRTLRQRRLLDPVERRTLIQSAGILAFFTIRSYPENSAALYSVDLLVLLPAIVFIAEADRRLRLMCQVREVHRAANRFGRAVTVTAGVSSHY